MVSGLQRTAACPRCQAPLSPSSIEVAELGCKLCEGVFIAPEMAAKILGEQGLTPAFIAELSGAVTTSKGCVCLGCSRQMQVLPLRGRSVDLCPGCGALWLDAGELRPLTGGKFDNGELKAPRALMRKPPVELTRFLAGKPLPSTEKGPAWFLVGSVGAVCVWGGLMDTAVANFVSPGMLVAAVAGAGLASMGNRYFRVSPDRRRLVEHWGWQRIPVWKRSHDLAMNPPRRVVIRYEIRKKKNRDAFDPHDEKWWIATLYFGDRHLRLSESVGRDGPVRKIAAYVGEVLGVPVEDSRD